MLISYLQNMIGTLFPPTSTVDYIANDIRHITYNIILNDCVLCIHYCISNADYVSVWGGWGKIYGSCRAISRAFLTQVKFWKYWGMRRSKAPPLMYRLPIQILRQLYPAYGGQWFRW